MSAGVEAPARRRGLRASSGRVAARLACASAHTYFAAGAGTEAERMAINIPNQITLARLALAIVFFALLSAYSAARAAQDQWILQVSFWLFLIAVLTDVLDGWLARTWNQVTSFGRVVDPVVDKVIVCGAFLFLASDRFYDPASGGNVTGVAPWMVVVLLTRELLVSAIRSFSEAQGEDFGASWVGKLKMFVQSATICIVLALLAWHEGRPTWLREGAVWATVIVTTLSIISYLGRARAFMLSSAALGGRAAPDATSPSPSAPTKPGASNPAASSKHPAAASQEGPC